MAPIFGNYVFNESSEIILYHKPISRCLPQENILWHSNNPPIKEHIFVLFPNFWEWSSHTVLFRFAPELHGVYTRASDCHKSNTQQKWSWSRQFVQLMSTAKIIDFIDRSGRLAPCALRHCSKLSNTTTVGKINVFAMGASRSFPFPPPLHYTIVRSCAKNLCSRWKQSYCMIILWIHLSLHSRCMISKSRCYRSEEWRKESGCQ
jgi:hypothetical protein